MNPKIDVFDRDAAVGGGYVYTSSTKLSCRLATRRTIEAILAADSFKGRSVLDMGCGDGFFSIQFWDRAQPREMIGVDAAEEAVEVARRNKGQRPIHFQTGDAHHLPWPNDRFDVVLIQSILHHDDEPHDMIREGFRLAPEILIREPNGNNLGLKMIEKLSRYHREHHEKSYFSWQLAGWIIQAGGEATYRKFSGFVPMFCPDALARLMKILEPAVEKLPGLKAVGCAEIVLRARRRR